MYFDVSVFLDATDDPNFDFQINSVEPGTEYEDLYITSQTRLSESNDISFAKKNKMLQQIYVFL